MKTYFLFAILQVIAAATYGQCAQPSDLTVININDTSATLTWKSQRTVSDLQVRYARINSSDWKEVWQEAAANQIILTGLMPHFVYRWEIRSMCIKDASVWVEGPEFTAGINGNPDAGISSVQILPNPNNGNFSLKITLPSWQLNTSITLYNNAGKKVWQHNNGKLGGTIYKNFYLENKLSSGVYLLVISRKDVRLEEKIIVNK